MRCGSRAFDGIDLLPLLSSGIVEEVRPDSATQVIRDDYAKASMKLLFRHNVKS